MPKTMRKISGRVGLPPGALIYTGEPKSREVRITMTVYGENFYGRQEVTALEQCTIAREKPSITWIDISGIHKVENLKKLGDCFAIHPLILEDILHTEQRPKAEDLEGYIYILLKHIRYDAERDDVTGEQVSLILGADYVLSFQESGQDIFATVRARLQNGRGRLRKMGADYLAYGLLDTIVDNYFVVVEQLGEKIELLEERLINDPTPQTLHRIHHLRREMILLRRSIWPLREAIASLERRESPLIRQTTVLYLRDVYDHTVQVIDTIETFRDMLTGMLDLYLSSAGNRLNAIMKVLTIIATIFMPLTFLAGVYGMNFKHMPELEWPWGYPLVLLLMFCIAASMLLYFRRKKWI